MRDHSLPGALPLVTYQRLTVRCDSAWPSFGRSCLVVVRRPWMWQHHPWKPESSMPVSFISSSKRSLAESRITSVPLTALHSIQMARGMHYFVSICFSINLVCCHNLRKGETLTKLKKITSNSLRQTHPPLMTSDEKGKCKFNFMGLAV